jgi:flagellum-specific peptidoglycan hydrolase FlgJ
MFLENNNMFGMKEAKSRINLVIGTQCGHAYFKSWEDCLLDYAYYRATYTSQLKTEQQFYEYLNNYYAEDLNYGNKLKNIVDKHNLKNKFI